MQLRRRRSHFGLKGGCDCTPVLLFLFVPPAHTGLFGRSAVFAMPWCFPLRFLHFGPCPRQGLTTALCPTEPSGTKSSVATPGWESHELRLERVAKFVSKSERVFVSVRRSLIRLKTIERRTGANCLAPRAGPLEGGASAFSYCTPFSTIFIAS